MNRWLAPLLLAAACGPITPPGPTADPQIHIVAGERGGSGTRLVVIDEHGDRQAQLTLPGRVPIRDQQAAFSPDGQWIAFASSRARDVEETSLWLVAAALDHAPVRLTVHQGTDLQPAWDPDGRSLVFASTRSGNLDLWRIALERDGASIKAGALTQLTRSEANELAPSVASDGRIAYAVIHSVDGTPRMSLEVMDASGKVTKLTEGPADTAPSFSPDGDQLAFSAPHIRDDKTADPDIWVMPSRGGERRAVIDVPSTEETGPVWSRDGKWLFATSIYRLPTTREIALSSVVHVELATADASAVRILRDRSGVTSRMGPALAPRQLDVAALRANPAYRQELAKALLRMVQDAAEPNPQGAAPKR